MNFFSKSTKTIEKDEKDKEKEEVLVSDLFWRDYKVNPFSASEIIVEVYREEKIELMKEVPTVHLGARLFEDGALKEDIVIHRFSNYGLFSAKSIYRHKSSAEFALSLGEFISKIILTGCEHYSHKVKKRFVSDSHIFYVNVPDGYLVSMPRAHPYYEKIAEFEMKEHAFLEKHFLAPSTDITDGLRAIRTEKALFIENNARNTKKDN